MLKKELIYIAVIAICTFVLGACLSFWHTMTTMKVLPENNGVVLIEIYGQEWVYEEDDPAICSPQN